MTLPHLFLAGTCKLCVCLALGFPNALTSVVAAVFQDGCISIGSIRFFIFYSALAYFVYSNVFSSKVSFIKRVFFSFNDLTVLFPQNCTASQAAKSVVAVDGKFFD